VPSNPTLKINRNLRLKERKIGKICVPLQHKQLRIRVTNTTALIEKSRLDEHPRISVFVLRIFLELETCNTPHPPRRFSTGVY